MSGSIGFFGVLFFVFLVLKLTGVIGWSWWRIAAALWGPLMVVVVLITVVSVFIL